MSGGLASMARGFGILILTTLASEIAADRSSFVQKDYTWLIASAGILAFLAAVGIGANERPPAF
jgi:hypothetical protein